MTLVDLDESYQNIPKSLHVARKKCHFNGVKSRVFFLLHQKGTLVKKKQEPYITVIQLVKGYQNHYHMTIHDLPFKNFWGQENSFF